MLAQGFLDLFFDAAHHLEYIFLFLRLSTKAAFAKAAFDTLWVYCQYFSDKLYGLEVPEHFRSGKTDLVQLKGFFFNSETNKLPVPVLKGKNVAKI